MTFTDRDMREQVALSLGTDGGDYDISAIVSEIQREYGTVDIDSVPGVAYWDIVTKHDQTATEKG